MATGYMENPIKLRFYLERYEKEKKFIKVYEKFTPNVRAKPLTGKFYARHDILSAADIKEEYVNLIARHKEMTPKEIYSFRPPSVNMEYGWFAAPLIPATRDPRLRFARKQSDFIANILLLRKLHSFPEKRFTGIPFKT